MLKINPEKDIKELEKFGFKKEIKKEKTHKYLHNKVTGGGMSVHIKQDDGRIWYCPDSYIMVKE